MNVNTLDPAWSSEARRPSPSSKRYGTVRWHRSLQTFGLEPAKPSMIQTKLVATLTGSKDRISGLLATNIKASSWWHKLPFHNCVAIKQNCTELPLTMKTPEWHLWSLTAPPPWLQGWGLLWLGAQEPPGGQPVYLLPPIKGLIKCWTWNPRYLRRKGEEVKDLFDIVCQTGRHVEALCLLSICYDVQCPLLHLKTKMLPFI